MVKQSGNETETVTARVPVETKERLKAKFPNNTISDIVKSLVNRLLEGKIIGFKIEV